MSRVSDQDRLMMQRRASAAERRNSPRMLIVLAMIVLLAAGVYALLGYTQRAGALRTLSSAQFTQRNVQSQLATYRSLQDPQESGDGPVIYDRLSSPLSLLQQAARNAEIEPPVFDSERSETATGSAHRRVFVFKEVYGRRGERPDPLGGGGGAGHRGDACAQPRDEAQARQDGLERDPEFLSVGEEAVISKRIGTSGSSFSRSGRHALGDNRVSVERHDESASARGHDRQGRHQPRPLADRSGR